MIETERLQKYFLLRMLYMQVAFTDCGGIFQQDLASCHAAKKVVKKVFQES